MTARGGILLSSTETVASPYLDAILRVFFNYLETACGIKRSMDFLGFALRFFFFDHSLTGCSDAGNMVL